MSDPVVDFLGKYLRQPRYRKVLFCATDVAEQIRNSVPVGEPKRDFLMLGAVGDLMGIDIVISEDASPGWYQLTIHDHCEVNAEARTVSHDRCSTVAKEGAVPVEHDWNMPHDIRYEGNDWQGCPPNCPYRINFLKETDAQD